MRIVNHAQKKGPKVRPSGLSPRAKIRQKWFEEWLANQGKWVELKCGCVADINLPDTISLLTKEPQIECPMNSIEHGFQPIKRGISYKQVLEIKYNVEFPKLTDEPPF